MSNVSVLIGSNTAELQSFFNSMEYYLSVSKAAKQRLDKELASSFSVFDYVSDNETMLSRILADLLNNNGSHGQGDLFMREFNGNYILVFLSPAGRIPQSITRWCELTKQGKAAAISFYPDIYDWLIRCRQQCEAEKVRHFIKDFADYIQYNLKGDFTVQESNNV